MNIVKSMHSSLLHQCFSYQEKHYFTATAIWGFRLTSGEPVLEQQLWAEIMSSFGSGEIFDAGMPKPVAEFLVHGACCAPAGTTIGAAGVSAEFAGIGKEIAVFGDRHWIKTLGIGAGVSDPIPFSEMPVSYARAFGGKDDARNPAGIGIEPVEVDGEMVQPLPNVEYPKLLVGAPGDRPEPAGLSRIDQMATQRMQRGGTYDQRYVDTTMPAYPDDINLETFNDACIDQWLPTFPGGNESYRITNMHPEHATLQGSLPAVRGRCFVEQASAGGDPEFREIDCRIDTVHFVPNSDLGVVMHRGTIEVAEDDAADILKLLVAHENLADEPRTEAHYREQMALRTDPDEAYKYLLNTAPLIPTGLRCGFSQIIDEGEQARGALITENINNFIDETKSDLEARQAGQLQEQLDAFEGDEQSRQQIQAALDKAKEIEARVPEDSELMQKIQPLKERIAPTNPDGSIDMTRIDLKAAEELRELLLSYAEEQKQEGIRQMEEQIAELRKIGADAEADKAQSVLDSLTLPPPLPRIDIDAIQEQIDASQAEADKEMHKLQSMGMLDNETLQKVQAAQEQNREQMKEAGKAIRDNYRIGAHLISGSASPHEGEEADIREALLKAHRTGGVTAGGDYAFIDLSGQDLGGIDLGGAYLEYVDFSNTDLTGANLEGAILAHAVLENTRLGGARLDRANIGSCRIIGSDFSGASMAEVILQHSEIRDTSFAGCDMSERNDLLMETTLDNVDFTGASLHKNIFIEQDLGDCRFENCDLSGTVFINPVLERSVFDGANLSEATIIKAQAGQTSFRGSNMTNVRFVGGSNLADADFTGADLSESNLRDAELDNTVFTGAVMHKTDFGQSMLRNAVFDRAVGHEAQFNKANLEHASLERVDFMQASMYKSRISSASFRDASLFNVNFMGCTHGDTDFSGADLKQTIFKDWHP